MGTLRTRFFVNAPHAPGCGAWAGVPAPYPAASPIASMVKTVLNIGTLIVLLQSISWSDTPDVKLRRGEFYELLLVTLFGMYLMVSSGHFLLFFIGQYKNERGDQQWRVIRCNRYGYIAEIERARYSIEERKP